MRGREWDMVEWSDMDDVYRVMWRGAKRKREMWSNGVDPGLNDVSVR